LFNSAVLILETLDRQHRASDLREQRFYAPAREIRIQPDVIPAPERAFDIVVIARELLAQLGIEKSKAGLPDAVEPVAFDKDERSHRHDRRHRSMRARGMDERHRGALAVPEQNRLAHFERIEELRQRLERLDVHEIDPERPGERLGSDFMHIEALETLPQLFD